MNGFKFLRATPAPAGEQPPILEGRKHFAASFVTQLTARPEPQLKRFKATVPFEVDGQKKMVIVKDEKNGGVVVDYRDVSIEGYLSTFGDGTDADRQGEYVMPGAFAETLKNFMGRNPVMLRDHFNNTGALVGKFTSAVEDNKGLRIVGLLSNAPDVASIRFKVAEGVLKAMSIGGIFHYAEDRRGIFKVDLFEGSLVPIPANPKCIVQARGLTDAEERCIKSGTLNFPEFETGGEGANP